MLSSPLRRCAITGLVMPSNLMFAIVPFAGKDEKESRPPEIADQFKEHERQLRSRTHPRVGARWARRHAQPSLLKALQRARRMARHKSVTAQTVESKTRFENQTKTLDEQIALLQRPNNAGKRYVVAKLGSVHMREMRLDDKLLVRNGRAAWITLEHSAVQALLKQKKEKRFAGVEAGVVEQIDDQLEADAFFLLRKITRTLRAESHRHLIVPSHDKTSVESIRRVAAVLHRSNTNSVHEVDESATPNYNLEDIFRDQSRREQAHKCLVGGCKLQESDESVFISQDVRTSEFCIALWRLTVFRRGKMLASQHSTAVSLEEEEIIA